MMKKAVSWVLVGAFAYLWTWTGHSWSYLNTPGNEWGGVFNLFTLVSLVVLLRGAEVVGAGLFDRLVGTVRNFVVTLPWMVLAIVVAQSVRWLNVGMYQDPLDHYAHAIVAVLVAGITTALWYGAIKNASD